MTSLPKIVFLSVISSLFLMTSSATAIEEPQYSVVEEKSGYEIRQYEPYAVASISVKTEFEDVGDKAFEDLFDYISGNNQARETIATNLPVEQRAMDGAAASQGIEIAMTAPVIQQATPSQTEQTTKYYFSFVLPEKYDSANAPVPKNPDIEIEQIPARTMAVKQYSGTWSQDNYEEHKTQLLNALKADVVKIVGEPMFARYNSPFSLWFLRRNEVMVEVEL